MPSHLVPLSFLFEASTTSCNKLSGVAKTAHAPGRWCRCTWKGGVMQNIRSNNLKWDTSKPRLQVSLFDVIILQGTTEKFWKRTAFLAADCYGYIECHKSEFPTFRGSLSSENSSRPATSAQFSPTIHCDINSESGEPDALHMAPTSSPKELTAQDLLGRDAQCPFDKFKGQHTIPGHLSPMHPHPPVVQGVKMDPRKKWPSWSTDESLSFRRNPMLCQEFAAIAWIDMLLPMIRAPWPHHLLHPFEKS